MPAKTRVLLPENARRELIKAAVAKFGGRKKLADFLRVNRRVPRWWEIGKHRPSIGQLRMLEVSSRVIANAENFGLEGSKKNLRFPKEITFDEEVAWFFGLRDGDSDETDFDVGIGNSDPEILRRAIQFFRKFFIGEEQLWLYIWTVESELDSAKEKWSKELKVPKAKISVYRARRQNKDFVKVRFSSLLFRLIVENLRARVDVLLQGSPTQVKAAYARGFLDAEGCVEDFGIILNQKATKKGLDNLRRLDWLLKELEINHGGVKYTNQGRFAYIRVPAQLGSDNLKKFQKVINFSSRSKTAKLSELVRIYENRNLEANRDLLKRGIVVWLNADNNSVTRFDVMRAFNLGRDKTRGIMKSLIKEGKVKATKKCKRWTYKSKSNVTSSGAV